MTPSIDTAAEPSISVIFAQAAAPAPRRTKRKRPAPFSLRLSPEERAQLEQAAEAAGLALATYIKLRLLNIPPPSSRPGGSGKRPAADTQLLAKLLALLGEARLANNLNQLAKAVNMGTIEVGAETEKQILAACSEVRAMRRDLVAALGLKA